MGAFWPIRVPRPLPAPGASGNIHNNLLIFQRFSVIRSPRCRQRAGRVAGRGLSGLAGGVSVPRRAELAWRTNSETLLPELMV